MKIQVAIHGWFENRAGWAFHPEIVPEVRRRLVADLGQETIGAVGPIDPRPLSGQPSFYVIGVRAEGLVAAEGERRKPILRLALLPGRPRSRDEAEAFLSRMDAVTAARPGYDDALQLEWEGDLLPLADGAEVRPKSRPRRWPGPFAVAAMFAALAILVIGAWAGSGWLREPDRTAGGEAAPEDVAGDVRDAGSQVPGNRLLSDFEKKAEGVSTIKAALALRDEYLQMKGKFVTPAETRAALAATGDAFWRVYFALEPDLKQATEDPGETKIYENISRQYSIVYQEKVEPFFDKLPEYRGEGTRAKLIQYPRWAKLRGAYKSFRQLVQMRRFSEASSLIREVRADNPEPEFRCLDEVIAKVEPVAERARQGVTVEVRDLRDETDETSIWKDWSQDHFGNGLQSVQVTLEVEPDDVVDGGKGVQIGGEWKGDRLVFKLPHPSRANRAAQNPRVKFHVVSKRDSARSKLGIPPPPQLSSDWNMIGDKERRYFVLKEGTPAFVVLRALRPPLNPPDIPEFFELFPNAPNSNPPQPQESMRNARAAPPNPR